MSPTKIEIRRVAGKTLYRALGSNVWTYNAGDVVKQGKLILMKGDQKPC